MIQMLWGVFSVIVVVGLTCLLIGIQSVRTYWLNYFTEIAASCSVIVSELDHWKVQSGDETPAESGLRTSDHCHYGPRTQRRLRKNAANRLQRLFEQAGGPRTVIADDLTVWETRLSRADDNSPRPRYSGGEGTMTVITLRFIPVVVSYLIQDLMIEPYSKKRSFWYICMVN